MKKHHLFLLLGLATQFCRADLIAHWPLDLDATDASGNGFNGTVVNGTVEFEQPGANANTGGAASFPDFGNIDIPFDAALNPESFTLALWVNASSTFGPHASPITNRDDSGVSTHGFVIYNAPGGSWEFWTGDGDPGWDNLPGESVTANVWTHLAVTYDAITDTKNLWVNGVLSATDTIPQSGSTQYSPNGTQGFKNFHLGSGGDLGDQYHFSGLIDDVGLWDDVLSEAVIQSIMTNGITSGQPDPALSSPGILEIDLDGSIQTIQIPISNSGQTQPLNLIDAQFALSQNFTVITLPDSIAPGGSDEITVQFDPRGSNGLFEGHLTLNSDDSLTPSQTILIRGSIHDPKIYPPLSVSLGNDSVGVVPLINQGATRSLEITSIEITGEDSDHFSLGAIPTTIPAGNQSREVTIYFDPLQQDGSFKATLILTTNDPITPSVEIEVQAIVPIANPLVAWWPLDVDGMDASGNGYDGLLVGNPIQTQGATDQSNGALLFDGSSRIDIPYSSALNPESFTVTLWAKAETTGGFASPITSRDDVSLGASTHGYILYNDSGGTWNFWTGDGNPGWDYLPGEPVAMNTWTHLAISYDALSQSKTIYINGIQMAQDIAPNQYSPNGTVEMEDLHIGAGQDDGENFWFSGAIDDVGLFRKALSLEEINAIMMNGVGDFSGVGGAPRIIDITRNSIGETSLTFSSVANAQYVIERSLDLGHSDPWTAVGDPLLGQDNTTQFFDRDLPQGATKLFYRVYRK